MKMYRGHRLSNGVPHVVVSTGLAGGNNTLPPRNDLANHSPDGFEWGYGGSGPSQLALAILADAFNDKTALRFYQRFRDMTVGCFKQDEPWELSLGQVAKCVLCLLLDDLDDLELVEMAEQIFKR